ncbi:putative E3 ubiquitin-protein ligase [Paratrimastix pyriformis]|uniref:E3 ubiquitin-protein ligase n=1 Tax=Paratrimastix pyriformis TaxID=342808 RepID=A0ABQ8UNA7_9EUKA|nr:putative E3 ubiquitin-protein ligase [Paratrimastix pyriformis]
MQKTHGDGEKEPPPPDGLTPTGTVTAGLGEKTNRPEIEPCAICLEPVPSTRAFLDPCFHSFCFYCIVQWASLHKPECPLCKRPFTKLIHSVVSVNEYQVTPIASFLADPSLAPDAFSPEAFLTPQQRIRRQVYLREMIPVADLATPAQQEQTNKLFLDDVSSTPAQKQDQERLLSRVRPWLHRELQAVLAEQDVTLIVDLCLGLLRNTPPFVTAPAPNTVIVSRHITVVCEMSASRVGCRRRDKCVGYVHSVGAVFLAAAATSHRLTPAR